MLELASGAQGKHSALVTPSFDIISSCMTYINVSLERQEHVVVEIAARANRALFDIMNKQDQDKWLDFIIEKCKTQPSYSGTNNLGYLSALAATYSSKFIEPTAKDRIVDTVVDAASPIGDIERKVAAVKALATIFSNGHGMRTHNVIAL